MPVGVSDFCSAVTDYYYVDKTLMIRDFLDTIPKVSLFTRPRRFGKTLNMEMLRVFFEKTEDDTSVYFKDKKIWDCGEKYRKHQGRYPVIFLTFKDVKHYTWEEFLENLSEVLSAEFDRHFVLQNSSKCSRSEKDYYRKIIEKKASEIELSNSLKTLSLMLHKHYGIAPIIIIDEYDTPVHQGYLNGYYDRIILFIRNLFSGGFKDNKHLSYGFLTGILRIAKESIFSGLNNLRENSILEDRFSEYFGFTKNDVRELLQYCGCEDRYGEICEWYDGYRFGDTEIFNPWSVINYIDNNCSARSYWISTGSNDIIREIVKDASVEMKEQLQHLMNKEAVNIYVDPSIIYPEIKNNPSSIYSFLLMAGYLKITETTVWDQGSAINRVAIPNKEIFGVYEKEILSAFPAEFSQATALGYIQPRIRKRQI